MSLVTGETVQFEFPEKPSHTDPFDIAEEIVRWAHVTAPYAPCNNYRPELAITRGAVNCYGVTQAVTRLAEHWQLPAAVALDRRHAAPFVKIGELLFCIDVVDPLKPVRTTHVEASFRNGGLDHAHVLRKLYEKHVSGPIENGFFSVYFEDHPYTDQEDYWSARTTDALRTNQNVRYSRDAHIIVDAAQGAEMLCAIGDLKRYHATDAERYEEKLPELIDYVPDFINLDPPNRY